MLIFPASATQSNSNWFITPRLWIWFNFWQSYSTPSHQPPSLCFYISVHLSACLGLVDSQTVMADSSRQGQWHPEKGHMYDWLSFNSTDLHCHYLLGLLHRHCSSWWLDQTICAKCLTVYAKNTVTFSKDLFSWYWLILHLGDSHFQLQC